jgi:Histidine kinase-, DNA gyrase B-, and HSP90-like ATPase
MSKKAKKPASSSNFNFFRQKGRWRRWLILLGLVIVAISTASSYYLAEMLENEEEIKIQHWKIAYQQLNYKTPGAECDITLLTQVLADNTSVPVIMVNPYGGIDGANNFGELLDQDTAFLRQQLKQIKKKGPLPIPVDTDYGQWQIYYKHSRLLLMLRFFPILQMLLIGGFIGFGYYLFNMARKAEQNLLWIGMAKETAHQLGTPISALMAWVEHLRSFHEEGGPKNEKQEQHAEIIVELDKDVARLEMIADRFSKIGSEPELQLDNVYTSLQRCYEYMEKRLPRQVELVFPDQHMPPIAININVHLFDWVIENLLRNAVDAMDGKGIISAAVFTNARYVVIEVTDTGKGIAPNLHKRIFEAGFTTRKRGWGLGLSLAKRIIVEYHNGKIFVKQSEPGEGATFAIWLPIIKEG